MPPPPPPPPSPPISISQSIRILRGDFTFHATSHSILACCVREFAKLCAQLVEIKSSSFMYAIPFRFTGPGPWPYPIRPTSRRTSNFFSPVGRSRSIACLSSAPGRAAPAPRLLTSSSSSVLNWPNRRRRERERGGGGVNSKWAYLLHTSFLPSLFPSS